MGFIIVEGAEDSYIVRPWSTLTVTELRDFELLLDRRTEIIQLILESEDDDPIWRLANDFELSWGLAEAIAFTPLPLFAKSQIDCLRAALDEAIKARPNLIPEEEA